MANDQTRRAQRRNTVWVALLVVAAVVLVSVYHNRRQQPTAGDFPALGDGAYELRVGPDQSLLLYNNERQQPAVEGIQRYRLINGRLFALTNACLVIVDLTDKTITSYAGIEDVPGDVSDVFSLMEASGQTTRDQCSPAG